MTKRRILAALLTFALVCGLSLGVFAASEKDAVIDRTRTGSFTVFKYDKTKADEAGEAYEDFDEDGEEQTAVPEALSKYAIQGVEFTYVKVSDVETFTTFTDGRGMVRGLYGLKDGAHDLLALLGLGDGDAEHTDGGTVYFTVDKLSEALAEKTAENSTLAKEALEGYVKSHGGQAMDETNAEGKSTASELPLGLYLVVETRVPENVTSTTDPFFVSLPSATADGNAWNYDVFVYPKNQTGDPTLEKTLREKKDDTGKNEGSEAITDGYAHTATASIGDTIEYQVISTLPTITSAATYLTAYTFVDVLSDGLTYNRDVEIEFFKDKGCTESIAKWSSGDEPMKFEAVYDAVQNKQTITMTEDGLKEINNAQTVHADAEGLASGYSTCTMRITYTAEVDGDAVLGDAGNPNEVELTWKRTNTTYYDTLRDDCHVFTYGLDLLKTFETEGGNLQNVKFVVQNTTDKYYVQATFAEGVYKVTGHTASEAEATKFVPTAEGHIVVRGLEDDEYLVTEVETDEGYMLLEKGISLEISTAAGDVCETCGEELVTASASVNGVAAAMVSEPTASDGSNNATVPLKVINYKQPAFPQTGDRGVWFLCIAGAAAMSVGCALLFGKKKSKAEK